jgi:hypothetical protein
MGDSSIPLNNYVGLGSTNGFGVDNIGNLAQGMNVANTIINYTATFTIAINAVIAFAGDFTSGKVWMAVNNVWFGGGNPATGVNPMVSLAGPSLGVSYFPAMSFNGPNSGVWTLQSTAASQTYTPPSGFTAWDS